MALNLERFFLEFKAEVDRLIPKTDKIYQPVQSALWMICVKHYHHKFAIERMAMKHDVSRIEINNYLRRVLPSEYYEALALDAKDNFTKRAAVAKRKKTKLKGTLNGLS